RDLRIRRSGCARYLARRAFTGPVMRMFVGALVHPHRLGSLRVPRLACRGWTNHRGAKGRGAERLGVAPHGGPMSLAQTDPDIARLIDDERDRQQRKIRLIPSENYVSRAVLEATGSELTNKYSEGYVGKRYYEGQQVVDQVEALAIERAKALFGTEHANVQPYSGSP